MFPRIRQFLVFLIECVSFLFLYVFILLVLLYRLFLQILLLLGDGQSSVCAGRMHWHTLRTLAMRDKGVQLAKRRSRVVARIEQTYI